MGEDIEIKTENLNLWYGTKQATDNWYKSS